MVFSVKMKTGVFFHYIINKIFSRKDKEDQAEIRKLKRKDKVNQLKLEKVVI